MKKPFISEKNKEKIKDSMEIFGNFLKQKKKKKKGIREKEKTQ